MINVSLTFEIDRQISAAEFCEILRKAADSVAGQLEFDIIGFPKVDESITILVENNLEVFFHRS